MVLIPLFLFVHSFVRSFIRSFVRSFISGLVHLESDSTPLSSEAKTFCLMLFIYLLEVVEGEVAVEGPDDEAREELEEQLVEELDGEAHVLDHRAVQEQRKALPVARQLRLHERRHVAPPELLRRQQGRRGRRG